MPSIEKVIKVVDAVCDCLPVVSTITNGAQLIYKLARKVDAAANPVNTTWKDDLKIHFINKDKHDCLIAMIPVIGNITSFIFFILDGFRDHLKQAVCRSNTEVVKLYLARHPLSDDKRGKNILEQAAFSSLPEVFNLILSAVEWSCQSLIEALPGVLGPDDKQERNAISILEKYGRKEQIPALIEDQIKGVVRILNEYINANRLETAGRILSILPECDFNNFKEILLNYSFTSHDSLRSEEGVLSNELIDPIINRCIITQVQLEEYCRDIRNKKRSLEKNIDSENRFNGKYGSGKPQLDKNSIVNEFCKVHRGTVQKLLNRVVNPTTTIDNLFGIITVAP